MSKIKLALLFALVASSSLFSIDNRCGKGWNCCLPEPGMRVYSSYCEGYRDPAFNVMIYTVIQCNYVACD